MGRKTLLCHSARVCHSVGMLFDSTSLREQRLALGLSRDEVAAVAGVSGETIRRIEGGNLIPRPKTALALANALDLDISALWIAGRDGTDTSHWVYRLFKDDVPLYVGFSKALLHRFATHGLNQPWWGDVTRVELTVHATGARARAVEIAEIKRLQPLYNIEHNPRFSRERAA
jgi:transcriptional regulator with XRE-family HTH domain